MINDQDPSLDLASEDGSLRLLLSLGATAGIALMALSLVPALWRAGVRLRFRPAWRHPAVRKLITLSGWTLGYVAANQVALIVVKNLAKPGSGGQDAYAKAFTFFQLPHGLLAVSITTTFVPDLARFVARKDKASFIARSSLGVRLVAFFTFPASFGLLVLARPIIGTFLQHGQFTEQAADTTARALAGFSLGLVGFSVYLFVLRGFYAHQDTRTPFVINVVENVLNIVFALLLVGRYGVLGLGLAFALAYLLSAAWALQVLSFKVPGYALAPVFASLGRMLLAAVLMAELVWVISRAVGGNSGAGAAVRVMVGSVVGIAVYLGVLAAPALARAGRRPARRSALVCAHDQAHAALVELPHRQAHRDLQRDGGPLRPARAGPPRGPGSAPPAEGAGGQRHRQPEAGGAAAQQAHDGPGEAERQRPSGPGDGRRRREGRATRPRPPSSPRRPRPSPPSSSRSRRTSET